MGIGIVVVGALAIVSSSHSFRASARVPGRSDVALIVVFGFFFVTVSSRIVGIIGTSSNPISGMTIATLMATCVIFLVVGWKGDVYQAVALCVGSIVCVAAANAGATSQDLKTGFLVGATPKSQQWGFIIGVVASSLVIGLTIIQLDKNFSSATEAHGIGWPRCRRPRRR
jgi:putative OPT family oligopeptide transporter